MRPRQGVFDLQVHAEYCGRHPRLQYVMDVTGIVRKPPFTPPIFVTDHLHMSTKKSLLSRSQVRLSLGTFQLLVSEIILSAAIWQAQMPSSRKAPTVPLWILG
jgi:hypothetical protein